MFTRKKPAAGEGRCDDGGRRVIPTWAQLLYLLCAVCFILALKGLSGPKTARNGNLIGAVAAVLACAIPFFYADLDHVPLILAAIAVGSVGRRGRRPRGADDPDAADGGAVQRRRRWRGRAGRAARAARDHRGRSPARRRDVHAGRRRAFTILVGSVSFAGSVVTFAKLQELMTSRPVIFPGLPVAFGGGFVAALGLSVVLVARPAMWVGVVLGAARPARRACCWCCRSAAPTCRSSSRCSTRSPASPSRPAATCSATRCCWSPAPWSARPARS